MRRRTLLKGLLALPAATVAGRLFAAPADGPRLLLVFLRGGYDCNHLLVPYSSAFYYEARPHLAIARPQPDATDGALRLDADWALAPAVRGSLGALYAQRQAALIPFAGTADLSRSHFETQDDIEAGQDPSRHLPHRSGFLARLADTLGPHTAPAAFTQSLPLAFRGGAGDVPNVDLRGRAHAVFDARQSALLAGMYRGTPQEAAVRDGLALRRDVARRFGNEMQRASRGAVHARGFALQAGRIATLMRDRFRLGFVDVGGWDTHVNQGGADGALADNLANLGQGLSAFARTMAEDWRDTVVVVVSEFGRTFRENGDRGTDHGHGSAYWVLGGGVRGGRVAGEQVAVRRDTLLQDRDYPVLNNYRDVLGGLFARLWGLSAQRLDGIFPGAAPRDLGLL